MSYKKCAICKFYKKNEFNSFIVVKNTMRKTSRRWWKFYGKLAVLQLPHYTVNFRNN